eukprot:SAG25_NODE_3386_length_1102_cov_1.168495_1_plen_298_part_10
MESESRAGYSGNCDLDINECTSSPCKNTALCEDSTQAGSTVAADAYRCKCAAGFANGACGYAFITQYKAACSVLESRLSKTYSGNCDQDVDECKSSPCQNGANCTHSAVAGSVGHHSYSCACNAGYASGMCGYAFIAQYRAACSVAEGGNCNVDVDECTSKPCHNGAKCTQSVNAYACACVAGFSSGSLGACEKDVDECASKPCANSAVCVESSRDASVSPDAYRCVCTAGFANGMCNYNFIGEYTDRCQVRESAENKSLSGNCDIDVNECDSNPCVNSAKCSDSTSDTALHAAEYA